MKQKQKKGLKTLKKVIDQRKMSQSEIAEFLGVTRSAVCSWQRVGMPLKHGFKLAELLEMSSMELAEDYGFKR